MRLEEKVVILLSIPFLPALRETFQDVRIT